MDNTLIWIAGLVVGVACGFFCYRTAEGKGRSAVGFGLLGFFLPLVGLIAVLLISPRTTSSSA